MATPPERFDTRAFSFGCTIVRLYLAMSRQPKVPLHLSRQVLASGTSIGANLAEARACQSRRDVTAKFSIALKEARETLYWLHLLIETGLLDRSMVAPVLREANELVSILTAARRRLAMSNPRGKPSPSGASLE